MNFAQYSTEEFHFYYADDIAKIAVDLTASGASMKDFSTGFKYVFEGFSLIKAKEVRKFVIFPFIINVILFSFALYWAIGEFREFTVWLAEDALPEQLDLPWFLAWVNSIYTWMIDLLGWLRYILWLLFFTVFFLVVFYTFTLVANLISSPFNGYFSAALEEMLTGEKPKHIDRGIKDEIIHAIKTEIQKLIYNFKYLIPLLLAVSFLFITYIGQPLIPFIWFIFGAWMFSLEYIDFPMGNYGFGVVKQRQEVKQHRQLALGFGSGLALMTMIPVVNFFAVPVGVAGATKLYIDHLKTHEKESLAIENKS